MICGSRQQLLDQNAHVWPSCSLRTAWRPARSLALAVTFWVASLSAPTVATGASPRSGLRTSRLRARWPRIPDFEILRSSSGSGQQQEEPREFPHNATLWPADAEAPRMFLLFMVYKSLLKPHLWQAFLTRAPPRQYRAFVHCKFSWICQMRLKSSNPLGLTVVPTVENSYCKDLVSPMVQLLKYAIAESAHPHDKFVFLSDSAIPVKPFSHIHSTLTASAESDFCIEPVSDWTELKAGDSSLALVKHSQWVTLGREHAWRLIQNWQTSDGGRGWSIPLTDPLKHRFAAKMVSMRKPNSKTCLDEWAIFAAIFGAVPSAETDDSRSPLLRLEGLSAPLHFSSGGQQAVNSVQGICRTFFTWGAGREAGPSSRLLDRLLEDRPETQLSCTHCDTSHPAVITRISDRGVRHLRSSDFLFARKFGEDVLTLDQFERIILST